LTRHLDPVEKAKPTYNPTKNATVVGGVKGISSIPRGLLTHPRASRATFI
jgi:hypothetical protein